MKHHFLASILLLVSLGVYSQEKEYDRKVYMYKTFEDYENDRGVFVGILSWYAGDKQSPNKLFLLDEKNKEWKLALSDYWGFKVDEFKFRNKTQGNKLALSIVKIKDKVLYANAYVTLNLVRFGKTEGSMQNSIKQYFYSDTIDGEIFDLTDLPKRERNNPFYYNLIKCIERANELRGDQPKLDGWGNCVYEY